MKVLTYTSSSKNSKLLQDAAPCCSKRVSACVSGQGSCVSCAGMLSNSACEEAAIPGALPVQAAGTGRCWKAPYWELPGASVSRDHNRENNMVICLHLL